MNPFLFCVKFFVKKGSFPASVESTTIASIQFNGENIN